ncbi:MAG: DUF5696 domain-containing protein [Treponema sp.]|nr:DUF5696 domain-containing protein [Treponema sp.]
MRRSIWLLVIIFISCTISACGKPRQIMERPVVLYEKDVEPEEEVIENEFLRLRFLPHTAEIILQDKTSGVEWYSAPPDASTDKAADYITAQLMKSQFTLQYADVSGVGETMYSGPQSVEQGFCEYELIEGGLEVRYTMGNVSRSYLIPPAMEEKRMVSYLDKMETDDRRKIEASYRLYDINNLRSSDNKATLLSQYPDLAHEKIYVLRENTQEFMKEQFEEFFAAADYTREDYYMDASRYASSSGADKPAFNITLRYTLDGKSLVVSVPFNQVAYRSAFPITRLDILPFMGAGSLTDEGYLLVPDGSGALIYFNNRKYGQIPYNIGVYGWDEAMPRDAVVSNSKAPFPVFGVHKNGAALLCIIEEGSAYASVHADVSGRNCSYNSVYASFDMVHGALMDISGRSDRAVYQYESGLSPDESITMRYTVCAEGGYVGMAKEYRSWLLDKYPSFKNKKDGGVPVAVEIIGAVNKTQHRLGMPVDLPLKLTSYRETADMIEDFAGFGWSNVHVKLNGWFNRSVDHSVPVKVKLIRELGGKSNFSRIVSAADNNNFTLYPEVDFLYIRDVKTFGGYSLYRDSARYINRKRIEKYPYSFVWYGERKQWGKLNHLARPASMLSMVDNFVKKSPSLGLRNIAFRNIGSTLSGDYNERRHVSREGAIRMRQDKLEELTNAGVGVMIKTGFSYSAPWASIITDIMLDDQDFGITDDAVPFYQIALHGLVPYTGKAINLAEDYTINMLKTIESGAGLYFSFMAEETAELQETKFRQFFANEYPKWIGDADALYRRFSADFGHLYNQAIVDHAILSSGVTITVYEDGTRVIVNTSANDWNYYGNSVKSKNYIVLGKGE